ncbi:MAG: hypothetical protein EU530_06440 [Promethearchaeota archaeon]|nr:MAG: hypothetical protein EU530_06440 [Candidatus Lokiarchaeota archaeon]
MEIHSIKVNANSNATESVSRLQTCLSNLISSFNDELLTTKVVLGGYGNPITTMEYLSKERNQNLLVFQNIAERLADHEKRDFLDELEKRIDSKGVLHIRFSKRLLAQNRIAISSQSDSIRILIKFSLHNHSFDIKKNFRELKEFLSGIGIIEDK